MDKRELDHALEAWARWVHLGKIMPSSKSLMEVMIENKGVFSFGNSGSKLLFNDCVESDIESALMKCATTKPNWAQVIRLHYGAITVSGLSPNARRQQKAEALGLGVKTYDRYLSEAKKFILNELGKRNR